MAHPLYGKQKKNKITLLHIIVLFLVLLAAMVFGFSYKQKQDALEKQAIEAKRQAEIAVELAEKAKENQLQAEKAAFEERKRKEQGKSAFLKAYDQLSLLNSKWGDAVILANSTSRIALSGPVGSMQTIRRETDQLLVPSCLTAPKATLIESMDHMINGFIYFMEKSESLTQLETEESIRLKQQFEKDLSACKASIELL